MFGAFWASIVFLVQALAFVPTSDASMDVRAHVTFAAVEEAPRPGKSSTADVPKRDAAYGHCRQTNDERTERSAPLVAGIHGIPDLSFQPIARGDASWAKAQVFDLRQRREPKRARAPPLTSSIRYSFTLSSEHEA